MNSLKNYLSKLRHLVLHRNENFALEGGITFGPGRDPKGDFFTKPRLSILWEQPEPFHMAEEAPNQKRVLGSWLGKIGKLRRSA